MQIDIITLFPEMYTSVFDHSIVKRAKDKGLVQIDTHNLRNWAKDRQKTVDDRPYGGGLGMIFKIDVIDRAVKSLKKRNSKVVLLDAAGETFSQDKALKLSREKHLIIIAGHYEGVDHRVHEKLADDVISIGNFVLTGGEIPAMVLVDAITRLIPGVLGKEASLKEESHAKKGFLEYPQYTRPGVYKGWKVPAVLLSGDHAKIAKWRKNKTEKQRSKT